MINKIPSNAHPMVLMLGAGATRGAVWKDEHKQEPLIPPPVDIDFFEIANQIRRQETPIIASKVLKEVYGLYHRISGIRLEEYYKDIETRAAVTEFTKPKNQPMKWDNRIKDLVELIRRVFVQTTSHPGKTGTLEPNHSKSHKEMTSCMRKGDTIITFNYDMLVEESFSDGSLWNPVTGYGSYAANFTSDWCRKWLKHHGVQKNKFGQYPKSKILLLKLHGSLNWVTYKTASDVIRLVPRPYRVRPKDRHVPVAIVPPSPRKPIDKKPFSDIWHEARSRLSRCKSIAIVGYSMPETDLYAKALFDEVIRERSLGKTSHRIDYLYLVDKDKDVRRKFIDFFSSALGHKGQIFQYESLNKFVGFEGK